MTATPDTTRGSDTSVAGPSPLSGSVTKAAAEAEVIDLDAFLPVVEETTTGPDADRYGARAFAMRDAIRLLRSLPASPRVEMVVRLVRATLGSVNVSVEELSKEVARREKLLGGKIGLVQAEVDALEKQLHAKRGELDRQRSNLKELATVRARLQIASNPTAHRPPPTPADAMKTPPHHPARMSGQRT